MVQLKRNLLSVALASAALMLAVQAQAQEAATKQDAPAKAKKEKDDAKNLDAVVVTGIRGGIERAIDIKKDATSIVEAVSAEDIGKLPDVSIAESIARLPGLAAQRVAGRAQVISVRGLSPDFATTLLNGREMVSTGDNRSVEFDQYPSELMAGVTVYKTPDASLVGQGLSGTIDMRTVRPLDYDKPVAAISGRWQRNSLGSAANQGATGNRFNASYIGQSADRTFGFVIGYSHSDTPIQENQVGLYEPWQAIGDNWRPGVPAGTYYSDGIKALRRTGYTKRDGVMATLEFRPSDAWTSTLDVFHSQSHQENTANQFEVHIGDYNGGYGRLNVVNAQINSNGTFTGGTAQNVYPLVRGMYNDRKDKIDAAGWRNEFFFGNGIKLTADASWSRAKRDELNLENNTQLLPAPQLDSVQLAFTSDGFSQLHPGRDYSNPANLYLANTIYGSGYGKVPKVLDELKSGRLVASLPAPRAMETVFSGIDVGVNYADRSKDKTQPEGSILLGAQGVTPIASDLQYGLVDLGFAGVGLIPSWNVPGAVARYMTFNPSDSSAPYLIPKAWTVLEKISTAFVQGNIDTMWGSVPVRGNVGVQIQHTDQSSRSRVWDSSQPAGQEIRPYQNGKTYTDVLPSLNLAFSLADDQTLRVALARQVARARVDQLRASVEFGVDTATGKPGAGGGNPLLDPWRANAFDISWEKYFGNKAYIAAAYFYKQLTSYIYTQTRDGYDFTSLLQGWVPPPGMTVPVQTTGTMSAPFNGKGGKLQGIELTASMPLDMVFGDSLRGFGVIASASFTDSSIKILDPESSSSVGSGPISLPGLSKQVYNLTAYYERNGFEFRINNRRRSDFIGEIGNFDGNRTLRYVVGENITDAQVSYTFGEGSRFNGLSLLLQANNLGDAAYRTYAGSKDRPLEYIKWGRTLLLGASYKF
ncbi:TonB-dependent receptor [Thermomonas haemolytica]|uniref:TonB-dependent receptor n=1 Tax=Thermomonas haemolytica TaxID=141949 RepID=A0A4R3NF43_9GAMM|nr:TonB-dependent receptor [Thermomonas haemolytica]TCT25859.1 TonB-dependent receptor [Thermomonas haemolytica]TNY30091.1 TonB-dependent receptor [Thermomonas haemolytica]